MNQDLALPKIETGKTSTTKINLWMVLALACIGAGVAGGIYAQVVGHHHAFANTREMPWGMLIGVYAYFAIISTGLCLMAAISHLFHVEKLLPLSNRMVWMSISVLLAAFTVIGLEIENPWRMPLGVLFHPNITSNIWWMGTLYGFAVGLLLLEFYLIVTKRYSAALIFGVLGAVAEAFANSNLGSVFASLAARPYWYGSQLPIFFLGCAVLSGCAAIILFTHYSHLFSGKKMSDQMFQGVRFTGKIMTMMLFLIMIATAWKIINAYCGTEEMMLAAESLVKGPLSTSFWLFEIGIGLALPFLLLMGTQMKSVQALSLAALMVLVGQFFARYNLVVAGVMVPQFLGFDNNPTYMSYLPTPSEYMLVLGGFGVVAFGFLVGERFFANVFSAHK